MLLRYEPPVQRAVHGAADDGAALVAVAAKRALLRCRREGARGIQRHRSRSDAVVIVILGALQRGARRGGVAEQLLVERGVQVRQRNDVGRAYRVQTLALHEMFTA